MPGNSSKTPASMIMAGVLQQRQFFNDQLRNKDYYDAAWFLFDVYCLLPMEAKEKLKIKDPPSAGNQNAITPDIQLKSRQWIEKHRSLVLNAIPVYVYDYFQRGRQMKVGY